ncbi:hypothetical protein RRG08_053560 [Elysia crispata]|uniref:Uncharacterized protein n=1 Tax=Elysia crispata TaxID=231223 RepID=A0AAE1CRB9_9GAST|nr:hypothetical protein RRG08_053560 [Elysia crispata]
MLTAVDHNKDNVHYESGTELHYNWYEWIPMLTAVDHNKDNVHYESGTELHYNWFLSWSVRVELDVRQSRAGDPHLGTVTNVAPLWTVDAATALGEFLLMFFTISLRCWRDRESGDTSREIPHHTSRTSSRSQRSRLPMGAGWGQGQALRRTGQLAGSLVSCPIVLYIGWVVGQLPYRPVHRLGRRSAALSSCVCARFDKFRDYLFMTLCQD